MRLVIAGSRGLVPSIPAIDHALGELRRRFASLQMAPVEEVISGTAEGADLQGERWARVHGIPVRTMPADWAQHGKRAGFVRNERMARVADAGLVFWDQMSRGSPNMVTWLVVHERPVHVVTWPWAEMGESP